MSFYPLIFIYINSAGLICVPIWNKRNQRWTNLRTQVTTPVRPWARLRWTRPRTKCFIYHHYILLIKNLWIQLSFFLFLLWRIFYFILSIIKLKLYSIILKFGVLIFIIHAFTHTIYIYIYKGINNCMIEINFIFFYG